MKKNNCGNGFYSTDDFTAAPKVDVHFHHDVMDDACLRLAGSINMRLVSVNTDMVEPIGKQFDITTRLHRQHPGLLDFLGTFPIFNFGEKDFAEQTIACIDHCMGLGAKGIKIWKNIGMALRDRQGRYVMIDDPAFTPVFAHLEKQAVPVMGHFGEPKNCWLPYEQMTTKGDLGYFRRNPQFHAFQLPEMPSYEAQMTSRDRVLERHPKLAFVGAHFGSLEWSLEELARRFENFPNFFVDVSARMSHFQLHVWRDRTNTQSFLTKYQDRILYGSDMGVSDASLTRIEDHKAWLLKTWSWNWNFFATDAVVPSDQFTDESAPKEMPGLRLPRAAVDKIFDANTRRVWA